MSETQVEAGVFMLTSADSLVMGRGCPERLRSLSYQSCTSHGDVDEHSSET